MTADATVFVVDDELEGVRMMTVHGAKGLEFPVVILADLQATIARTRPSMYVDPDRKLAAFRMVGCL